jgi:hypothetical protein
MRLFAQGKRIVLVLAVVILGAASGATAAIASGLFADGTKGEEDYIGFYQLSYDRATPEQREQLDAIIADDWFGWGVDSSGGMGQKRRDIHITLGDLPADTPRLTAQDAANLYGKVPFDQLDDEFNKIAGAPDWVGGSGITTTVYFMNDERTESIVLSLGDVSHWVTNKDGTRTRLPVGTQVLPPNPGPSPAPEPGQSLTGGTPELPPELGPSATEAPNLNVQ